jgi:B12 binding domain
MRESGIDTTDPAAVLVVIKRLGASKCEELFGAGVRDDAYPRGRRPVLETDLVHQTMTELARLYLGTQKADLGGKRLVLASTDVHEFAKFLLDAAMDKAGARVIDAGVNRDPEDIVSAAVESAAEAIVITTHNGVARSFAQVLRAELDKAQLSDLPVFIGGVLNEDIEGSEIPVDVRADLVGLRVQPLATIEDLVGRLASPAPRTATATLRALRDASERGTARSNRRLARSLRPLGRSVAGILLSSLATPTCWSPLSRCQAGDH